MVEAWKSQILRIVKVEDEKLFFDAEQFGEVEVQNTDLVMKYEVGQTEMVYLYYDSNGQIAGCLGEPLANIGEFAYLTCVANTKYGSFLDWGIDKDLFCPFKEQKEDLVRDESYVVYIYVDEDTNRAVASTKFNKFLHSDERPQLEEQQKVKALVARRTNLGFNLIVENKYVGILYSNEVFCDLQIGDQIDVIVKKIRDDNKLDLRMYRNDHNDISNFEKKIIDYLKKHKGEMSICDNSEPEIIYDAFGISKKNFKKALGALYKKKIVELNDNCVKLIKE